MRLLIRDLLRGAAAGTAATLPMSAVMLAAQRFGALPKQPPEEIVDSALDAADVDVDEETSDALATLNHFAFGASIGAAYAGLRRATGRRGSGPATGIVYALVVWFASYQGWVPKVTPLPPATRDREDRQTVMAGAHVVYGAVLGGLVDRWSPRH
jgi:hypothetical protein